jgi:hypothetical protein
MNQDQETPKQGLRKKFISFLDESHLKGLCKGLPSYVGWLASPGGIISTLHTDSMLKNEAREKINPSPRGSVPTESLVAIRAKQTHRQYDPRPGTRHRACGRGSGA